MKYSDYLRYPKTYQEHRANDAHASEYDITIRGRRTKRGLVTCWDDQTRTLTRSWKDKKVSKQWMKHNK